MQTDLAEEQLPAGFPQNEIAFTRNSAYQKLCTDLQATGRFGQIYVQSGKYVVNVLRGDADPLEIYLPGWWRSMSLYHLYALEAHVVDYYFT